MSGQSSSHDPVFRRVLGVPANAASRLPAVIPLVVHHNRRPWSGATELAELIDLDHGAAKELDDFLPRFSFLLDDLAVVDEQTLRERPLTPGVRFTFAVLKAAEGHPHLADDLRRWDDQVHAMLDLPGGKMMLQALVEYIGKVAETSDDELHDWFAHLGPDAEEVYMTTAKMLEAKGHAVGHAEGRVEGQAETLIQLLTIKFGPLHQATVDAVRNASVDQLQTWTTRILSADTIDDVLH